MDHVGRPRARRRAEPPGEAGASPRARDHTFTHPVRSTAPGADIVSGPAYAGIEAAIVDTAAVDEGTEPGRPDTTTPNSNDPVEPRVVVPVTLTVQNPPDIDVSGETREVRTHHHAQVAWAGAMTEEVDVYRDGDKLATTQNDGSNRDQPARANHPAAHVDQVCPAGSSVCSDELRLGFGSANHPDRQLPVLVTNG